MFYIFLFLFINIFGENYSDIYFPNNEKFLDQNYINNPNDYIYEYREEECRKDIRIKIYKIETDAKYIDYLEELIYNEYIKDEDLKKWKDFKRFMNKYKKYENEIDIDFEKYLEDQININTTFITELINGKTIDKFETHTKAIENILRPLYRDNKLDSFIEFALIKREEDRRQNYKATEKYELPKRVLNIRDIEKDEKYLNTYLGLN